MPIRVSCACGKQLQALDAAAGKKVRCPACQAAVTVPASAPPAFEVVDSPPKPAPAPPSAVIQKPQLPKSPAPVEDKPKVPAKPALSLDDEPEEAPPKKPTKKPSKADPDRDDETDEPPPRKTAKKAANRDETSEEEGRSKKPRKKRPLWVTLLALGCGGFLMLTCIGGSVLGGFLYYLNSQQDKVAGKWVVDEGAPENSAIPLLNRAMQFDFDQKDKRCTMRLLGVEFTGKWRVVRNRENDAILVLVDFEDARGPDGQKVNTGKEKFQSAFEITPVDADHIDLVDVKERSVRMRMKKVESFDKTPGKADNTSPDKPPAKKPDEPPTKKPDEPPPGPKYPLVLRGHNGLIWGLTFAPDGTAVATACDDSKVRVYDPTTGQLRSTLSGHTSAATGVVILPDGGFVTTGGSTTKDVGEVFVWGPAGGSPKQKLLTSKNKVYSLAGSLDGKLFAWDDYVHIALWDRDTGEVRHRLPGISSPKGLAFSRDGKWLVGVDAFSVMVWDTETGKPLPKIAVQKPSCVAFTPTGELVIGTESKSTYLYDPATGKVGQDIQKGRGQPAQAVAVSPDGRFLAHGGGQAVMVYDFVAKDWVTTWTPRDANVPRHVPGQLAFSRDGTKLVSGTTELSDYYAIVWDMKSVIAKAKK